MFLLIALVMGLVGSAHCAGMCGPLVMAYQHVLRSRSPFWLGLYHIGRFTGYAAIVTLGYTFHWAFNMAGWQQVLSVICGLLVLIFVFKPRWIEKVYAPGAQKLVHWLSSRFYTNAQTMPKGVLAIGGGAINGLLPCGLSYMAAAGAVALPTYTAALLFMLFFTLGTAPVLLLAVYGQKWISRSRFYTRRSFQTIILIMLSSLLILRGANLNIPYLSPGVHAHHVAPCCAKKHKSL